MKPSTTDPAAALQTFRARYEHLENTQIKTPFHSGAGWYCHAGYEQCERGDYYWDGEKRGGDPAHPYFIFQYTFDGFGIYEVNGERYKVGPGSAFVTTVPSAHAYYMPPDSPAWCIFHLTFSHPYIVSRLIERLQLAGPVIAVAPGTRLLAASIRLLNEAYEPSGLDQYSYEQALFEWMIEFERATQSLIYPEDQREQWLQEVRSRLNQQFSGQLDVSALAAAKGMSRTYYSHQFKATTGIS
ncbi:MAG TPA: AraC family ligand binding domain-containing protein, partial [Abditibacteriaceae bacterium]